MSGALTFLQTVAGFAQQQAKKDPTPTAETNRLAIIDPAYDPTTYPTTLPKVRFDGETALSSKRYTVLGSYWPRPGDRVLMLPVGGSYVIADQTGNPTPNLTLRAIEEVRASAAANCNATPADIGGTTRQVNVTRAGAVWVVVGFADFTNFASGAATTGIVHLNVEGTDQDEEILWNQANVGTGLRSVPGQFWRGTFSSPGLKTFKMRALRAPSPASGADNLVRVNALHTGYLLIVAE